VNLVSVDGTGLSDIASSRSCSETVETSRHVILGSKAEDCPSESVLHSDSTQISSPHSRNTDPNGEYSSALDISISPTRSDHEKYAESIKCLQDQLVSRESPNRWTPLMISCMYAPPQVISLLTKVSPDSCAIPDRSGSLPLHFGCWRHATLSEHLKESEHIGGCPNGQDGILREVDEFASYSDDTSIQNEACIVLSILIATFPEALATANRWGHTPLHSLFESIRSLNPPKSLRLRGIESENCLAIVETLLGKWDKEIWDYLQSNSCVISQHCLETLKEAIQSDVKRALRTRDAKGRLPLHAAAGCQWANEQIFRALILPFPAAAWIPVIMPVNDLEKSSGRSSTTSFSWDINGVIIEEDNEEDEENSQTNSIEGLFPPSGGCLGKDLAVHILHRKFLSPTSPTAKHRSMYGELDAQEDDGVKSCVTDSSVFLDERHCGEVSALLDPIVSAWSNLTDISSRMDVRSACGATGSGQCSDSEGNESLLTSHSSSIAASLSSTLLPLHIAAIHGVSFEILHGLCSAYPEGAHRGAQSNQITIAHGST